MSLKVLVTGSRFITDHTVIYAALEEVWLKHNPLILIQGGAKGADAIAKYWGEHVHNVSVVTMPANWKYDGRYAAGPTRNSRMLELGPDLCLAFFLEGQKNSGTMDMATKARNAGVETRGFQIPAIPDTMEQ